MNRKTKNIITGIILIILIGITTLTIYYAGNSIQNNNAIPEMNPMPEMNESSPPEMPEDDSREERQRPNEIEESNEEEKNTSTKRERKEKKSNETEEENTPPEIPNNEDSNKGMTPPERTDESGNTPPEKPSGDNNMPGMPQENQPMEERNFNNNQTLNNWYYFLFGLEGLLIGFTITYWLLSNFHEKSIKETLAKKDKIIILALSTTLITSGLTYIDGVLAKNLFTKDNNIRMQDQNTVNASATKIVTEKETLKDTYESTKSDESAVLVTNEGNATIKNATINKKKGDTTNTENSDFYGANAGVLVQKNSKATIKKSIIKTSAKGANAVFSTGTNSKVYISDTTIETTGESSSRGLDATYGGYIEADNVTITTEGGSSATLATDRGEGTIIASNSKLETNGSGSPVIYSTGDITINNTEGVANGSQMVVIEGKNCATITNSNLTASGKGNRKDVDQAGVMIYQSMSGDADEGTGTLTVKDSTLTIQENSDYFKTAPMFFITNTNGVINLENTKLNYGSNQLILIQGTEEWGKRDNNGGNGILHATNQSLEGDIILDNLSTLTLNLTNNSNYKGSINNQNKAKEINIKLDKTSTLTLTEDSYITSLENEDESYSNIIFNGHTLYVNGTALK